MPVCEVYAGLWFTCHLAGGADSPVRDRLVTTRPGSSLAFRFPAVLVHLQGQGSGPVAVRAADAGHLHRCSGAAVLSPGAS
jgi:hypothetical protein